MKVPFMAGGVDPSDMTVRAPARHPPWGEISEPAGYAALTRPARCGYRAGWMVVSGERGHAQDYIEGLTILASMRLCANVPAQYAIQTALGGYQSIDDLVLPTGRLGKQRNLAHQLLTTIPGVSCVKPQAALYLFPRLDPKLYPIADDQQFVLELLLEEKVLLVQGTGFNWPQPDHLRVVFLPHEDDLVDAIGRFGRFLERYRKRHSV